jgi:hypothetical protein
MPELGGRTGTINSTGASSVDTELGAAVAQGDNLTPNSAPWVMSELVAYNESVWNRLRNNTAVPILTTAVRAATTNASDQTNYNARGVLVVLDITANPGGAETLQMVIQSRAIVAANYSELATYPVTAAAANATYFYILYPGSAETIATGRLEIQGLPLPRTWRPRIVHSAGGNWTYTVDAYYIW